MVGRLDRFFTFSFSSVTRAVGRSLLRHDRHKYSLPRVAKWEAGQRLRNPPLSIFCCPLKSAEFSLTETKQAGLFFPLLS